MNSKIITLQMIISLLTLLYYIYRDIIIKKEVTNKFATPIYIIMSTRKHVIIIFKSREAFKLLIMNTNQ